MASLDGPEPAPGGIDYRCLQVCHSYTFHNRMNPVVVRRAAGPLLGGAFLLAMVLLLVTSSSASVAAPLAPRTSEPSASRPQVAPVSAAANLGYDPGLLGSLVDPAPLSPQTPVTLGISLSLRNSSRLDQVALGAATPGSPLAGDFVNRSQFLQDYAPTTADYGAVLGSLGAAGLIPVTTYSDHLFVMARGPASAAESLFGTTLVTGHLEGRTVVLPETAPHLPSTLAPFVSSVTGLSQNTTTFSYGLHRLPQVLATSIMPDYPHFMYGLNNLYNVSANGLWSTGETIALILWGDGYDPQDLSNFAAMYYPAGQPAFTINPVPLNGAPAPGPQALADPSGAPFELTLDMEWSESQAPGATLMPIYVPDGSPSNHYSPSDVGLENAVNYAVNASSVNVISMSFGSPDGQDPPFQTAMDNAFRAASAQGKSVFASSGDNGGSTSTTQGSCTTSPQVEYPATSPWVTAVGGTAPTVNLGVGSTGGGSIQSETAWTQSTGGFSSYYSAPGWQLKGSAGQLILSEGGGHRGVPDVSGPSANNLLYYNGSLQAGEGTSFASPMWAGIAAEMDSAHGNGLGLLTPTLYALGAAGENGTAPVSFNDVTQGNNCLWNAGTGWDPVTGWGSPKDILTLYGNTIGGLVTLSLSFSPSVATPGGTETLTVTASSSRGTVSGLKVNVALFSQPPLIAQTSQLGRFSLSIGSSGTGSGTFTVPISYAFDNLLVRAGVLTSNQAGLSMATLNVSALGSFWGPLQPLLSYPLNIPFFLLLLGAATALGWWLGLRKPQPVVRRPAVRAPGPKGPAPAPVQRPPAATQAAAGPPNASPSSPRPAGVAPSTTVQKTPTPRPAPVAATREPPMKPLSPVVSAGAPPPPVMSSSETPPPKLTPTEAPILQAQDVPVVAPELSTFAAIQADQTEEETEEPDQPAEASDSPSPGEEDGDAALPEEDETSTVPETELPETPTATEAAGGVEETAPAELPAETEEPTPSTPEAISEVPDTPPAETPTLPETPAPEPSAPPVEEAPVTETLPPAAVPVEPANRRIPKKTVGAKAAPVKKAPTPKPAAKPVERPVKKEVKETKPSKPDPKGKSKTTKTKTASR